MVKTAIFVEGQTELIFVKEMLLKLFEYHNIDIDFYVLQKGGNWGSTEYPITNPTATYHFTVINAGGDGAVLSRILERESFIWSGGFGRIIGLRDMYSQEYRERTKGRGIDETTNQTLIKFYRNRIDTKAQYPDKIFFSFAIMEIEAWLLGIPAIFECIDEKLTIENIDRLLNINLNEIDPETTFFRPAKEIGAILKLVEKNYDKHKGDSYALASRIEKEDYEALNESEKCASFSKFYQYLPNTKTSEN